MGFKVSSIDRRPVRLLNHIHVRGTFVNDVTPYQNRITIKSVLLYDTLVLNTIIIPSTHPSTENQNRTMTVQYNRGIFLANSRQFWRWSTTRTSRKFSDRKAGTMSIANALFKEAADDKRFLFDGLVVLRARPI